MGLSTTVPTNKRVPGAYHEFDFTAAGAALVPFDRRVVIVAEKTAAGSATADTPVQVFGDADGDAKFGPGSLAALLNRAALAQANLGGIGSPEIWVCPVDELGGGTAAIYTLAFTGPATASGEVVVTVAGRIISVGVSSGDANTAIASAFEAECDRLAATLPVTASVVGATVSLTFNTKGVNGNGLERTTVRRPAGVGITHAAPTPGAGTTVIAGALAALYDRPYDFVAFANHAPGDATAILADAALTWNFDNKNFKFYGLAENGSLGTAQTLQASFNDFRVLITSCEATGTLPGELAVMTGVAWMARENPNANLDDERLAATPPPAASAYTGPEHESALASGLTPLAPDGPFVRIVRLVTSVITVGGVQFEPTREPAGPRTAAYLARQCDAGFRSRFKQQVLDTKPENDIRQRVRDMVIAIHREAEAKDPPILRDVDSHLEEIQCEIAASPAGRLLISDPFTYASPVHQGCFKHIMYQ